MKIRTREQINRLTQDEVIKITRDIYKRGFNNLSLLYRGRV